MCALAGGKVEIILEVFDVIIEQIERGPGATPGRAGDDGAFFIRATKLLIKNILTLFVATGQPFRDQGRPGVRAVDPSVG